jgi:hypothetical protein
MLELLGELGHAAGRAAILVAKSNLPATGNVDVVSRGLFVEAPGLAKFCSKRQRLCGAAAAGHRHFPLQLPATNACPQGRLVTGNGRRDHAVILDDRRNAHALLAVDEVQHEALFFAGDVETERQLSARQRQRCAVAAGLQFAAQAIAARDGSSGSHERDQDAPERRPGQPQRALR